MKETFYRAVNSFTIKNLLRIIKNYTDEKYIEDVLVELRELKDDSYQEGEFQEVIEALSKEAKVCPICGNGLVEKVVTEAHTYLDDIPKEQFLSYFCEDCGFDSSED